MPQVAGTPLQVAGVKAGDWANYDVSQHVTGNATLVQGYVDIYGAYANTRYVSLNVTQVLDGTNVSLTLGIHHADGTIISSSSTINVTADWQPENPPIVMMKNYPPTLSSVTTGVFFNVSRTINNLIVNSPMGRVSSALRYSWDKETGLLLRQLFLYTVDENETNTGTFTYSFVMTGTSLWHAPPNTPPSKNSPVSPSGPQFIEIYALAGVVGSLILGVVAYGLRRSPEAKRLHRKST